MVCPASHSVSTKVLGLETTVFHISFLWPLCNREQCRNAQSKFKPWWCKAGGRNCVHMNTHMHTHTHARTHTRTHTESKTHTMRPLVNLGCLWGRDSGNDGCKVFKARSHHFGKTHLRLNIHKVVVDQPLNLESGLLGPNLYSVIYLNSELGKTLFESCFRTIHFSLYSSRLWFKIAKFRGRVGN